MHRAIATIALGLLAAGCQGKIGAPSGEPGPDAPITGPIASAPGPSSRLVRLSHKQWANTVGDLLGLGGPAPQGRELLAESVRTSFDNNGGALDVPTELWQDYERAAGAVATMVARDPGRLAALLPPRAAADRTGRAFIESVGRRAYRRPLTEAETGRYLALFGQGPALIGSGDAFADGVELVVTALLQSPWFLYRTELGPAAGGKVVLGDYEVASRLSYGLTNSMPDEPLFAAAEARRLHTREDLLAQARRLLATPAGEATVRDFHEQLFHTAGYGDVKRDPARLPGFTLGLGYHMREEAAAFVRDVVLARDEGLTELLTAPYTFVNSRLAPLYGLPATGLTEALVRVDLDPAQRAGLFTQIGFLGSNDNATDLVTRPIMRGKHVSLDLLCTTLPAPPNVPPLPAMTGAKTNRQLIEAFTQQPGTICVQCHGALINPLGFAFEHYDPLGRYRTTDNGVPVDARDEYAFAEGERGFDGAVELMGIIAGGRQAHDCYARRLAEYLYGRELGDVAADRALVEEVGRRSHGEASIKAMILDLVSTDAFLTRLP